MPRHDHAQDHPRQPEEGSEALAEGAARGRRRGARSSRTRTPDAPATPTLRDVQHALAREHGLPGWTALKDRLAEDAPIRALRASRRGARDGVPHAATRRDAHRVGLLRPHARVGRACAGTCASIWARPKQPQSPAKTMTITLAEAQLPRRARAGLRELDGARALRGFRAARHNAHRGESRRRVSRRRIGIAAAWPHARATGTRSSRVMRERRLPGCTRAGR